MSVLSILSWSNLPFRDRSNERKCHRRTIARRIEKGVSSLEGLVIDYAKSRTREYHSLAISPTRPDNSSFLEPQSHPAFPAPRFEVKRSMIRRGGSDPPMNVDIFHSCSKYLKGRQTNHLLRNTQFIPVVCAPPQVRLGTLTLKYQTAPAPSHHTLAMAL